MIRRVRRWPGPIVGAWVLLFVLPDPAHAHLVNTGLGPFFDGISHLALTVEDLLPVLALALLAGLRGAQHGRRLLFVLPLAWLLGGLAGLDRSTEVLVPELTTLSFVLLGVLVAADRKLPVNGVSMIGVAFGLLHGYLNGTAMAQAQLGAVGILGIVSAVFVCVALVSGHVVLLRDGWPRIAIRVAGSWIAAIGFLMLGWLLRGV